MDEQQKLNEFEAATYDAWASSGFFTIGSTGAARVVAINVNRSLPAPAGATIIWTAVGSGGTAGPLQYRFVRYSQKTGLWTVLQ